MASPVLSVVIPGKPRPQGSMQLSRDERTGKEFAKYGQETVNHRNLAVDVLRRGWGARPALTGPVGVECRFVFVRPKSHFGTGRNAQQLKEWAPRFMASAPDSDKLLRLICDAMTIAGVVDDDRLVVLIRGEKVYGARAASLVRVYDLGGDLT